MTVKHFMSDKCLLLCRIDCLNSISMMIVEVAVEIVNGGGSKLGQL